MKRKIIENRPSFIIKDGIYTENLYEGDWNIETNKPDGHGTMVFHVDGAIYSGYFEDAKFHGNGLYFYGKGKKAGEVL